MNRFQQYMPERFLAQSGCIGYLPALLMLSLSGCSSPAQSVDHLTSKQQDSQQRAHAETSVPLSAYEASRQRMQQKFGSIGAELRVDAMAGQDFYGVEFFPEGSDRPFFTKSHASLANRDVMSMPLAIPERVTVVWHASANKPNTGKYGQTTYPDSIIGTDTIEVGSRIPQEVLDSLRRERGGLRLKFRLSNDGVYFGWDIERRPGYDPNKRDPISRIPYYALPVYSMTGGDFKEVRVTSVDRNEVREKGWYIDKKTGKKVEVDF